MLKQLVAVIRRWFSANQSNKDPRRTQGNEICETRRGFFKKAAFGAASITGTAGLAKVVAESVPQPDMSDKYIQDGLAGEQELGEREYVLMSDQEKSDMVKSFVDNYPGQG